MHNICIEYFKAKEASLALQTLKPEDRKKIIERLADLLQERKADILAANRRDMATAKQEGNLYYFSFELAYFHAPAILNNVCSSVPGFFVNVAPPIPLDIFSSNLHTVLATYLYM